MKNENKKPTPRENYMGRYKSALKTLKHICGDCGLDYEREFPNVPEEIGENVSDNELCVMAEKLKANVRDLIKKYFYDKWMDIIDVTYDDNHRGTIVKLISKFVENDSVNLYRSCLMTCNSLVNLNNPEKKETELRNLEEYSSQNSIEDVTNTYNMLQYSNYRKEVEEAILSGFKRNEKVNFEYAKALFGNVQEAPQPGQE